MTVPIPGDVEDYRQLGWREAGRCLASDVVMWVAIAPGLLTGLWLTRTWTSFAAGWVTGVCAAGSLAIGLAGGWLVRQLGRSRPTRRIRAEPLRLVRTIVRGEVAVVTHPSGVGVHPGTWWLVIVPCVVFVVALLRDTLADTLGPGVIVAWSLLGGAVGAMLAQLWSGLAGPRVALFPDRLEISRLFGRRAVPWRNVLLAVDNASGGGVSVHVAGGGKLRAEIGSGACEVADAIERFRSDPTARAGITWHIQPHR